MADNDIHAARRAKVEFEQTATAFESVRAAMIDRLLASHVTQTEVREKLYLAVQVLDAMRERLSQVASTADIEAYAAEIREQGLT